MTKTEANPRILAELAQRQRRFEWELARAEQTRAAARMVAGRTHAMLNMVQVVQLATIALEPACSEAGKEYLADLQRAANDAQTELAELMAVARPDVEIEKGAPVGAAVAAALATLRRVIDVDIHLATPPDTCTRCTARELEHLLIGLALDVIDQPGRIELFVRERVIDGRRWIEIVRASTGAPEGAPETDHFELRTVSAIADGVGGELATSERRGGGLELVVALPTVD